MSEGLMHLNVNLMTLVICLMFFLLFAMLWAKRKVLDCTDLITSPDGRISRTAIGQVLGIVVAVWAPVYTALDGKLQVEVFVVSLAYLGLVEGYAKYLRHKADLNKESK